MVRKCSFTSEPKALVHAEAPASFSHLFPSLHSLPLLPSEASSQRASSFCSRSILVLVWTVLYEVTLDTSLLLSGLQLHSYILENQAKFSGRGTQLRYPSHISELHVPSFVCLAEVSALAPAPSGQSLGPLWTKIGTNILNPQHVQFPGKGARPSMTSTPMEAHTHG